ncbi:hypothetical protein [Campylobacter sp. M4]|uniref:hypothetical protein n=1 Tax=Campylobacter sp. M4 TaxID=3424761 RepID=UPI003D34F4D5
MKKYLILLPIALAILTFSYGTYHQTIKLIDLKKISTNLKEQIVLKDIIRAFFIERQAIIDAIDKDTILQNDIAKKLRDEVNEKIGHLKNEELAASMLEQLANAREFIKQGNIKYSAVFINFDKTLNNKILQNYSTFARSDHISIQEKTYILSTISIHSHIAKMLDDRKFMLDALQNKTVPNKRVISDWLDMESLAEISSQDLLDDEINAKILNITEKNYGKELFEEFKSARQNFVTKEQIITEKDIIMLYRLKIYLTSLLTQISDVIDEKLLSSNEENINNAKLLLFLFTMLSLLFMYKFFIAYKDVLRYQKIKEATNEAKQKFNIQSDDDSHANIIKILSDITQGLQDEKGYIDGLNRLKNNYMTHIAKKNKLLLKENSQALAFLKKELKDVECIKVINLIEENFSATHLIIENLSKIANFKQENLVCKTSTFCPQSTFKKALEANIYEIEKRRINYATYIDPSIKNEVEGDENKIITIIANIIFGATAQCNAYSKLYVEIKPADFTKSSDVSQILVSVKNDAKPMSEAKIATILDADKNRLLTADYSDFWLSMANLYLKMIGLELNIKSTPNVGNEFFFTLRLRIKNVRESLYDKFTKNVAFIEDNNKEYNDFFKRTMDGLGIKFKSFANDTKLLTGHNYDIVFIRNEHEVSSALKNLIEIKDPLTPLGILSFMQTNSQLKSAKFSLLKPQILLIEDNGISVKFAEFAFRNYNINLTISHNFEPLSTQSENEFTIIFTSINLTNTNVAETIKRIKDENPNFKTPIIAMISNTSKFLSQQTIEMFDSTIKKPMAGEELEKILTKYINNIESFKKQGNLEKTNKHILLYKKTPLENKIFAGALKEFSEYLTVANSIDELEKELKEKPFGAVLIDENAAGFEMDKVILDVDEARIRYSVDSRLFIFSEISKELGGLKSYVRTLSPQINKTKLSSIIKNLQRDAENSEYLERERERERELIN